MTGAGRVAAIALCLMVWLAASATPAAAAAIELFLGSDPGAQLLSYGFTGKPIDSPGTNLYVTSEIGPWAPSWVHDAETGHLFPTAVLIEVLGSGSVLTYNFSDVLVSSVATEEIGTDSRIRAYFTYSSVRADLSTIPEASTWTMLLVGAGALAAGRHVGSKRTRSTFLRLSAWFARWAHALA
jgi:hypothetical protein